MKYTSEDDIKKALGVDSLANLSEEHIERFGMMMPEMDKEVALAIIGQFPEFARFAGETVQSIEREHMSTLQANAESEARHHEIQLECLGILKGQLDKDLPADERVRVTGYVKEISDKSFEKDSESKRFLDGLMDKEVLTKVVTLVAALVFIGAKAVVERRPPKV